MTLLLQDRPLLDAFRRGENRALTTVYRAYSPRVTRYLAGGFGVRSAAGSARAALTPLDLESAHQETFVRAFTEKLRLAYDGLRPYEGFVLTIARSTAVDLCRASGRVSRDALPIDESPEALDAAHDDPSPEDHALAEEIRSLVRAFLDGLPATNRDFALKRFAEGLSQEAAASAVGMTRGQVRVLERSVRQAFHRHLVATGWLASAGAAARAAVRTVTALLSRL